MVRFSKSEGGLAMPEVLIEALKIAYRKRQQEIDSLFQDGPTWEQESGLDFIDKAICSRNTYLPFVPFVY